MESLKMLQKEAAEFLRKAYGIELKIPIKVNGRLKTTLGRFIRKAGKSTAIELSADLVRFHDRKVVIDVLKHELVHYACFELGKPFKDGEEYFERELEKHGVCKTRTYAYKGSMHVYRCLSCNNVSYRHRKYATDNKGILKSRICGRCRGKLRYVGMQVIT
jgi:SprT-like protein